MRKFALGLILGIVLALLIVPQPAQTQEITCAWPCICVCPTSTPTATATPLPTATPTETPLPTATPACGTLRIGHITDLHAGSTRNNPYAVSYTVADLNVKADIVVETGDCTDDARSWALHDSWLAPLTIPRYTVAGNHDAWATNGAATSWAMDVNGYRIIGINSPYCDATWLSQQWTTSPAVIASHYPLSLMSAGCRDEIIAHGVLAVIHGHLHLNQVVTTSGVLEICTARGGLGSYRVVTLQGGVIVATQ